MKYIVLSISGRLYLQLEGLHTEAVEIISTGFSLQARNILDGVASYLNVLSNSKVELAEKTKELLMASLDGKELARVQDDVARMLLYPDLDGFIKENYSVSYENINPTQDREVIIITEKEILEGMEELEKERENQ